MTPPKESLPEVVEREIARYDSRFPAHREFRRIALLAFTEGRRSGLEYWKEAHGHAKQAIESWCEKLESAEADRDSAEQLLTEMVQAHAESEAALNRARELLREALGGMLPRGNRERIQKELGERD